MLVFPLPVPFYGPREGGLFVYGLLAELSNDRMKGERMNGLTLSLVFATACRAIWRCDTHLTEMPTDYYFKTDHIFYPSSEKTDVCYLFLRKYTRQEGIARHLIPVTRQAISSGCRVIACQLPADRI